ncbi:MAG: hypothetical protein AB9903_10795 [Vulcanimicrobiota bacterium]
MRDEHKRDITEPEDSGEPSSPSRALTMDELASTPDCGTLIRKSLLYGHKESYEVIARVFTPATAMSLPQRLRITLHTIDILTEKPEKKPDDEELLITALGLAKDIFLLPQERTTFLSILTTMRLSAVKAVKSHILSGLPHTTEGQAALHLLLFSRGYYLAHGSDDAALEYAEDLLRSICFEEADIVALPLPNSTKEAVPREMLRRKLFSFIYNSDPKWITSRPKIALRDLGYTEAGAEERSFDGFSWRIYDICYQYQRGLDNKNELRRIAQDLLEMDDPKSYETYGKIYMVTPLSLLAVDSAYALIQATQFRTRKPKGPTEEYRKMADDTLKKALSDETVPREVIFRLLSIHRNLGSFSLLCEHFRQIEASMDWEERHETFLSLLSCYMQTLTRQEQEEKMEEMLAALLPMIKESTHKLYLQIVQILQSLSAQPSLLRDRLRKELKSILADIDVSAEVRKRALECIGMLGEVKPQPKKRSTILEDLLNENDDDDVEMDEKTSGAEEVKTPSAPPATKLSAPPPASVPVKAEISQDTEDMEMVLIAAPSLPQPLQRFLSSRGKSEELKAECARLLRERDPGTVRHYHYLLVARESESGKLKYDHICAAAISLLSHLQRKREQARHQSLMKEELLLEDKAHEALFWTFFHRECPDLLKMEAFETLKNTHYFEFSQGDTLKRFSLAFARLALVTKSNNAAVKALADLIKLRASTRSIDSLEGKESDELMEDMIFHLMKEIDESVKAKWIELLHHVTFQDVKSLGALASRVHPIHYRGALDVAGALVSRHNRGAGDLIIESTDREYRDIRNYAIETLGRVGSSLSREQRVKAISTVLDKLDECYDEDIRSVFLETVLKIDAASGAGEILTRLMKVSFHERREFGELLFRCLEQLKAPAFVEIFEKEANLTIIKAFMTSLPLDASLRMKAKKFVGMYRESYIEIYGKKRWEELQSSVTDARRTSLRDISKLI